jgi:hypothetical protein
MLLAGNPDIGDSDFSFAPIPDTQLAMLKPSWPFDFAVSDPKRQSGGKSPLDFTFS